MKLKKIGILIILILITNLSTIVVKADNRDIADMPYDWSYEAIENALNNGWIKAINNKIEPNEPLTRARMLAIINSAFNSKARDSADNYEDVNHNHWYLKDIQKALAMGIVSGYGNKIYPNKLITREEAFVVLARTIKIAEDVSVPYEYADYDKVSPWAKNEVYSMLNLGFVNGYNGKINPKGTITKKEFIQLLYNLIPLTISESESINGVINGNVMINKEGLMLSKAVIEGDLIIGDGLDKGRVILSDVTVKGRLLVRGGGDKAVSIYGNSKIDNVVLAKQREEVGVIISETSKVANIEIINDLDKVFIEGDSCNLLVKAKTEIELNNSEIKNIISNITDTRIKVNSKSKVDNVNIQSSSANSIIDVDGDVKFVNIMAPNCMLKGNGTIECANIVGNADNSSVEIKDINLNIDEDVRNVKDKNGVDFKSGSSYNLKNYYKEDQKLPIGSTVYSSASEVKPGEEIHFSWNKDPYADYYIVYVYKDNELLDTLDDCHSLSKKYQVTESGNYSIKVCSVNDSGSILSNTVRFVAKEPSENKVEELNVVKKEKPGSTSITCSGTSFKVGDKVTFNWPSATNANSYDLHIVKDGERINKINVAGNSYKYTISKVGQYTVGIYPLNSEGYTSGGTCKFSCNAIVKKEKPGSTSITCSGTSFNVGDKVKFNWTSATGAKHYDVYIYQGSTKVKSITNLTGNSTTCNLPAGSYKTHVVAVNDTGDTNSNTVNFTVKEKIIQKPSKEEFKVGDKVYVNGYAFSNAHGNGSRTKNLVNKYLEITIILDENKYKNNIHVYPYGWVAKDQIQFSKEKDENSNSNNNSIDTNIIEAASGFTKSNNKKLSKVKWYIEETGNLFYILNDTSLPDDILEEYSNQKSTKFKLVFSQLGSGISDLIDIAAGYLETGNINHSESVALYIDLFEAIITESINNTSKEKSADIYEEIQRNQEVISGLSTSEEIFTAILLNSTNNNLDTIEVLQNSGIRESLKAIDKCFKGVDYASQVIAVFGYDYAEEIAMLNTIEKIYSEYASNDQAVIIKEASKILGLKYSKEYLDKAFYLIKENGASLIASKILGGTVGAAETILNLTAKFSGISSAKENYGMCNMLALSNKYFKLYNQLARNLVVSGSGNEEDAQKYIDSYRLAKYSSIAYFKAIKKIVPDTVNYNDKTAYSVLNESIRLLSNYFGLEEYLNLKEVLVDKDEIENFIKSNKGSNLSNIQKEALRIHINSYADTDILRKEYIDGKSSEPLIFFFEGAEDNKEDYHLNSSTFHKDGMFKAMAVVIINGKIKDVFTDASTLPDEPEEDVSTINAGVYKFTSERRKKNGKDRFFNINGKKYPYYALRLKTISGGMKIPATRGSGKNEHPEGGALGILVHAGYANPSKTHPSSSGCLTIHYKTYDDFQDSVGYRDENKTISGFIVVDRLKPTCFR